ncbi:ankyrin repeat-containing domain protein [Chytriomyces cf. hyalinus JEL632]|nr:ankyrin repeat-containing domain protein [Chytriomyces cf. hyalinus JEL632]
MDLLDAVQSGSLMLTQTALAQLSARMNAQDVAQSIVETRSKDSDYTAIHFAAANNDVTILSALLDAVAVVQTDLSSLCARNGNTILHVAAMRGSVDTVKLLCKVYDPNSTKRVSDSEVVNLSHPTSDKKGSTTRRLVNTTNAWGETPLSLAAAANALETCRILVEASPSALDMVDQWGRNPIQIAAQNGYDKLADLIRTWAKEFGLDLAALDLNSSKSPPPPPPPAPGPPAPPLAPQAPPPPVAGISGVNLPTAIAPVTNELMAALAKRNERVSTVAAQVQVKHIFSSHTESINQPNSSAAVAPVQATPQLKKLKAISSYIEYPGDRDALTCMLKNSSEYSVLGRDMFGWSALHKLASWNKPDLLQLVLDAIPSEDGVSDNSNADGFTAMHCAIDNGAVDAVSVLVRDGRIDPDGVRDKKQRSARDLAAANGLEHLLETRK